MEYKHCFLANFHNRLITRFSDEEQLVLATAQGRVFFTFNVDDFCRLQGHFLAEGGDRAGIVVSSQDYSIGEQVRRVLKLMSVESAASMMNRIIFLSAYFAEL